MVAVTRNAPPQHTVGQRNEGRQARPAAMVVPPCSISISSRYLSLYSQSESISLRELLGLLPGLLFIISVDYYLKKVDYYSN
jgi:hypothetical protein